MDVAGPLVASGTSNSLISVFYNDAADSVDFTVNSDLSQYNNTTSQFFSLSGVLGAVYGGTGTSTSAWTGLPFIEGGVWNSTTTLSVMYGGTGYGSYTSGDLLYAGSDNTLHKLGIDSNGKILTIVNGLPGWTSTTTLGMDISEISGILPVNQGGTGQNFASTTGFIYLDNGVAIASATVAISYTDLAASSGITLNGNMLTLNTSGDWDGTFDGEDGSYYLALANATGDLDDISDGTTYVRLTAVKDAYIDQDVTFGSSPTFDNANMSGNISVWTNNSGYLTQAFASSTYWQFATTTLDYWFAGSAGIDTDGLDEGVVNLYWTAERFDTRLAATTSLSNLTSLSGLSVVGVIATGTWEADVIDVAHGGTGLSGVTSQSILYASSDNVIGQFTIGDNGEVLSVVGGQLQWSSTTAPVAHGILSVYHNDTKATGTLLRGDLLLADSDNEWSRLALGPAGYIFYSDGTDAMWSTTTAITSLGAITVGTWLANTIDIAYGGTGATTAAGARENLDLDEIHEFGINSTGTTGWLWQSDGDGRGHWVATGTLGIAGGGQIGKFIGTTTFTTDGSIATSSYVGYQAANYQCAYEFTGGHMCRTHEILQTIEQDDFSAWGVDISSAWIAEGPPGYTWDSNDCNGWRDNGGTQLGAFWLFSTNGGGAGWLVNCTTVKAIACCVWQ